MKIMNIALLSVIGVIIVACLIATIVSWSKKRKQKKNGLVPEVKNDAKEQTKPMPNANVTLTKSDVIIATHATVKVEKGGKLAPGKYTILSADSSVDAFNVRVGKFVKEYKHGDVLVVAEGEEITPTSQTIILR